MKHITTNDVAQRRAESHAQAVAARRTERRQGVTVVRRAERQWKQQRWEQALRDSTERGWFEQQVCREAP